MNQQLLYIVDDNQDMLEYFEELLGHDYRIETFTEPRAALESFNIHQLPDLIITDYKMPEMDGIGFIKALKAKRIERPVIILSGAADKEMALKALNLGVFAILEKPANRTELLHTVRHGVAHHLSVKLSSVLLSEYQDLSSAMSKLIDNYHKRMAKAENQLLANSDSSGMKREETMKILENLSLGRELEKRVRDSKETIKVLNQEFAILQKFLSKAKDQNDQVA